MCLPYIALFFFITVLPWPSSQTAYTPDLHLEAAQRSLAPLNLEGNMTRGAVIALSHGGGPLPLLGDPSHRHIVESLKTRVPEILRLNTPNAPRAIVVVTAHWSETQPTISSAQKHSLLYDYYGFPPETYKLKYNAPGSPEVAQEVANALKEVGLKPVLDEERGWDHGVFIPMLLVHPAADIPIVQVSVLSDESPASHILMGRALGRLRDSNIAIIGSGFASLHNIRIMMSATAADPKFHDRNVEWSRAVSAAIMEGDNEKREKELASWRNWPNAYEMHPRHGAEHFLPLIVAAAAGDGKAQSYADEFMSLQMFSYYWN